MIYPIWIHICLKKSNISSSIKDLENKTVDVGGWGCRWSLWKSLSESVYFDDIENKPESLVLSNSPDIFYKKKSNILPKSAFFVKFVLLHWKLKLTINQNQIYEQLWFICQLLWHYRTYIVSVKRTWVLKQDPGDGKMKEISDYIYEGTCIP
jgi:hypothetical protein